MIDRETNTITNREPTLSDVLSAVNSMRDEVHSVDAKCNELQVSVGMLFRAEWSQEQRFKDIEERVQNRASIQAGKSGGRYGALVAGLATVLAAVISKLFNI